MEEEPIREVVRIINNDCSRDVCQVYDLKELGHDGWWLDVENSVGEHIISRKAGKEIAKAGFAITAVSKAMHDDEDLTRVWVNKISTEVVTTLE